MFKLGKNFASDNNAGVHEKIITALEEANSGHAIGYGDDPYTKRAISIFKSLLSEEVDIYFVYGGTGANVAGLSAVLNPYQSIVCSETAHINVDECGAPEKYTGSKIVTLETEEGKITPEQIEPLLHTKGFEHHSQPKVISISQCTELGTVYSCEELKKLANFAHKNDMLVHLDGARISNAVVALNCSFKEMLIDTGIDIISFGGTKNGMMLGEAVIFTNPSLSKDMKYIRKQSMQLYSKMRFISTQFIAYFKEDIWQINAKHANSMAKKLESKLKNIKEIEIVYPVETNAVFAKIPSTWIEQLQSKYFFYIWDNEESIVRWMCSFDTTEEDIDRFVGSIDEIRKGSGI